MIKIIDIYIILYIGENFNSCRFLYRFFNKIFTNLRGKNGVVSLSQRVAKRREGVE